MITRSHDNFSHRIGSSLDSEESFQFAMYCEELARLHFGNVHSHEYTLEPRERMSPQQVWAVLDAAVEAMSPTANSRESQDGVLSTRTALGDGWALKITVAHRWQIGDEDRDTEPEAKEIENVQVCLHAVSEEVPRRLLCDLQERGLCLPGTTGKPAEMTVYFASPDERRTVAVSSRKCAKMHFGDYHQNYTPEVVGEVRQLADALERATHGIVIISGPPGTGKSYLIRMLISGSSRKAVVCSPPSLFLKEARYLNKVTERFKRSMVVLEDVGDFLTQENVTQHIDVASTLLNYSEGLLSLLSDTVFILSFNVNIGKVSEAITRPGRCLANIRVGLLPHPQAQSLVKFPIPARSYTLAEVYEANRAGRAARGGKAEGLGFQARQ